MTGSGESDRLTAVLEHAQDIIIVVDADGTIQYVNPAIERILGYPPEERIGENAFELMHPDDQEEVFSRFSELLDRPGAATDRIRHRLEHADGGWRWFESVGSNHTDEALDGYVINTRDVTDRKRREAELQRQNERLEEFASIVSHDLRNPLNVAMARLELAREQRDDEHLEAVARAHDRIETLIADLLTLARTGEQLGELDRVELGSFTETCWQSVETGKATIVTDVDRTIDADRSRLRQLLENLIRNAVEHGGEDVTVRVGELPDGVYVEDDGPGIPPDDREDVFDAGYSTTTGGTGFGLSIVEQVAAAHGWDVTVTDGTDGGARFEITGFEGTEA
jgi:PAS domain S-box-containing protein